MDGMIEEANASSNVEDVKWTCWVDEEVKAEGAIVGSRESVLEWMKATYPGLCKVRENVMVPAWYFFYEDDAELYETENGDDLYLVRGPAIEDRPEITPEEEAKLEQALKNYRERNAGMDAAKGKCGNGYDLEHTFVTSDHHFGSWKVNPCPWRGPVFTKEQEDELIDKWNSVVGPDDIVLYNGDFHDCGLTDLIEYRKRLNGRIVLVKGNHDNLPNEVYEAVFGNVHDRLVLEDLNLVLAHVPCFDPELKEFQIYGHKHEPSGMMHALDEKRSFCSCVMRNDGYPVTLGKILPKAD